ncbi:hypothetical protein BDV96DRAFT_566982 [Lophiotrema nucula]|uniref:Uncharacterized protein n=1 Tax=Lophiotrema nucula TaxID=690887 RepID=A0A6A5ZPX0_9PLEO|nr:hypothetical protein BDV96DRAFT_566982 [Lophiotrema nucula]
MRLPCQTRGVGASFSKTDYNNVETRQYNLRHRVSVFMKRWIKFSISNCVLSVGRG